MRLIDQLRADCGYHPEAEGSVDDLIAYKDALEDLIGRVDEVALANSGAPEAEAYRDRNDVYALSAADVMGELFSMGFGEAPEPDDPYGEATRTIKAAVRRALSSVRAMSQDEQAILIDIEERLRVLDNA